MIRGSQTGLEVMGSILGVLYFVKKCTSALMRRGPLKLYSTEMCLSEKCHTAIDSFSNYLLLNEEKGLEILTLSADIDDVDDGDADEDDS